ncbi:cell surface protein [Nonlabens ulvanivorans]|nr:hypothetical protein [Nonlabens ulvanivorans]GAK93924.1 cell surface protein [Nonlabens ulvanivorans]
MRTLIYTIVAAATIISCTDKAAIPQDWQFEKVIELDGINPIGIAMDGNDIFLSDGDHNRVVKISEDGSILFEMDGFERPMHIDFGEADFEITDKVTTSLLKERAFLYQNMGEILLL